MAKIEAENKYIRNKIALNKIKGIGDTLISIASKKWWRSGNETYPVLIDSNTFQTLTDSNRINIISYFKKMSDVKLVDSTTLANTEHYYILWIEANDSSWYYNKINDNAIEVPCLQIECGGCRKQNCTSSGGVKYELKHIDSLLYFTGNSFDYYY